MRFKYFRDNLTNEKRTLFMRDYFALNKKDFKLLTSFNPDLIDYYNDKSLAEYSPYLDFMYDIIFKPTNEKIRFKIRYVKDSDDEDDQFEILCSEYDEQQIFYINENAQVEDTLSDFLREVEEEALLRKECER